MDSDRQWKQTSFCKENGKILTYLSLDTKKIMKTQGQRIWTAETKKERRDSTMGHGLQTHSSLSAYFKDPT